MTENATPKIKKDIKIVVDEEHGIKEFGSDTFENLITHFVECDYDEKKKDLEDSINDKDITKLKNVIHKIKTLTMYMNCVDLAQLCKDIEYYTQKGHENHEIAFEMVPEFLRYFALLYDEANRLYRAKYLNIPIQEPPETTAAETKEKSLEKDDLSTIKEDTEISKLGEILEPELDGIHERARTTREKTIHDLCFNERTGSKHPSQESKILSFHSLGPIRNQNFINIESVSTDKKFTFSGSQENTEKTENDIFIAEMSPTIEKNVIDDEFKEKLKIFIEIEAPKLSTSINDAIELDKKEELIDALKQLKSAAAICFFNQMVLKIEEWCSFIVKKTSVKDMSKHLDKILLTIQKMVEKAKEIITGKVYTSNNAKNYVFSVTQPKIAVPITKDYLGSPGYKKSQQTQGTNLVPQPTTLNNYLISKGSEEDSILLELKPLKYDGLFKKEMTEEEIAEEIKKLTESTSKDQTYTQNKSRFSKQAMKPVNDNSYPFKQETFKLNCLII